MKKLFAIFLFFVVNIFSGSVVNAEKMVQVTDMTPQAFMNDMKRAVKLDEMRKFAVLDFADLELHEELNYTELNLNAWTSLFSIAGEIKGVLGLYTNDKNIVHLIIIYPNYSGFESNEQGQKIIFALLMAAFYEVGLSSDEFGKLYKGVIDATPDNHVWCEKAQRYVIANRTDDGVIFIAGGML